jgi:RND family efflux transporter MFP subunit
MIAALPPHLWQSTLFALAAGLLALLFRKERAQVRYWIWFSASIKFLIPFAPLIFIGSYLGRMPDVPQSVERLAGPFTGALPVLPAAPGATPWIPLALLAVWAVGFSAVALFRFRGWRSMRALVRTSAPAGTASQVEIRSIEPGRSMEPAVAGIFRPVLLLPANLRERLTPEQFDSILAHELCHVRRRDNLFTAIHMVVEAVFWFHPLVWWMGSQLLRERERACDEEVLCTGADPRVYVDGILKVCASYLEPPLASAAGVAGADLKRRIVAILTHGAPGDLSVSRKMALTIALAMVLAAPVFLGMLHPMVVAAQPQPVPKGNAQPVTTPTSGYIAALGSVSAVTVVVKPRVDGQLTSVNFKEGELVHQGQVLASIDADEYRFAIQQEEATLQRDEAQLQEVLITKKPVTPKAEFAAMMAQFESTLKSDRARVDRARLQMAYAKVTAPITGVAGLRLVDPGNTVRASDPTGLLTITQLDPIAVVFGIQEDKVTQAVAALRKGVTVPVEAWDRANTRRIASGRLVAIDNQADVTSGTVKVKAAFDNRERTLFPNQFVNVRVFLAAE